MPALNLPRTLRRLPLVRFSLRTLLVVVTAVWLGWYLYSAKQQHAAVAEIRQYGGWVHYDYQLAGHKFDPQGRSWVLDWMQTQLGDDMFHNVVEVLFDLPEIKDIGVRNTNVSL